MLQQTNPNGFALADFLEALPSPLIDISPRESVFKLVMSFLVERSAVFARLVDIRHKVSGLEACYDDVLKVQGLE